MPRLTTTLTATAFASLGWLEYSAITGRSFGVVTGAASDSFAQAGKFGRQVSELSAELLDPLLLLLPEALLANARHDIELTTYRLLTP